MTTRTFDRNAMRRALLDQAYQQYCRWQRDDELAIAVNNIMRLDLGDGSICSWYGLALDRGVVTDEQVDAAREAYGDRWHYSGS